MTLLEIKQRTCRREHKNCKLIHVTRFRQFVREKKKQLKNDLINRSALPKKN